MTPEKFNLNIQTPEGEEGNDEITKLKAELMAIKPPLDDAIKRQNLKEAEELFAKAKELKAQLDILRKSKEIKTIEINGQTLELGPTLGEMTWDEIPSKLEEINKTLKPGEKPWRVPTKEEFEEIGKQVNEINNGYSYPDEQKQAKVKAKMKSLGFEHGESYWSGTEYTAGDAWLSSWYNHVISFYGSKERQISVRCVR
jgi:hypothetical protein